MKKHLFLTAFLCSVMAFAQNPDFDPKDVFKIDKRNFLQKIEDSKRAPHKLTQSEFDALPEIVKDYIRREQKRILKEIELTGNNLAAIDETAVTTVNFYQKRGIDTKVTFHELERLVEKWAKKKVSPLLIVNVFLVTKKEIEDAYATAWAKKEKKFSRKDIVNANIPQVLKKEYQGYRKNKESRVHLIILRTRIYPILNELLKSMWKLNLGLIENMPETVQKNLTLENQIENLFRKFPELEEQFVLFENNKIKKKEYYESFKDYLLKKNQKMRDELYEKILAYKRLLKYQNAPLTGVDGFIRRNGKKVITILPKTVEVTLDLTIGNLLYYGGGGISYLAGGTWDYGTSFGVSFIDFNRNLMDNYLGGSVATELMNAKYFSRLSSRLQGSEERYFTELWALNGDAWKTFGHAFGSFNPIAQSLGVLTQVVLEPIDEAFFGIIKSTQGWSQEEFLKKRETSTGLKLGLFAWDGVKIAISLLIARNTNSIIAKVTRGAATKSMTFTQMVGVASGMSFATAVGQELYRASEEEASLDLTNVLLSSFRVAENTIHSTAGSLLFMSALARLGVGISARGNFTPQAVLRAQRLTKLTDFGEGSLSLPETMYMMDMAKDWMQMLGSGIILGTNIVDTTDISLAGIPKAIGRLIRARSDLFPNTKIPDYPYDGRLKDLPQQERIELASIWRKNRFLGSGKYEKGNRGFEAIQRAREVLGSDVVSEDQAREWASAIEEAHNIKNSDHELKKDLNKRKRDFLKKAGLPDDVIFLIMRESYAGEMAEEDLAFNEDKNNDEVEDAQPLAYYVAIIREGRKATKARRLSAINLAQKIHKSQIIPILAEIILSEDHLELRAEVTEILGRMTHNEDIESAEDLHKAVTETGLPRDGEMYHKEKKHGFTHEEMAKLERLPLLERIQTLISRLLEKPKLEISYGAYEIESWGENVVEAGLDQEIVGTLVTQLLETEDARVREFLCKILAKVPELMRNHLAQVIGFLRENAKNLDADSLIFLTHLLRQVDKNNFFELHIESFAENKREGLQNFVETAAKVQEKPAEFKQVIEGFNGVFTNLSGSEFYEIILYALSLENPLSQIHVLSSLLYESESENRIVIIKILKRIYYNWDSAIKGFVNPSEESIPALKTELKALFNQMRITICAILDNQGQYNAQQLGQLLVELTYYNDSFLMHNNSLEVVAHIINIAVNSENKELRAAGFAAFNNLDDFEIIPIMERFLVSPVVSKEAFTLIGKWEDPQKNRKYVERILALQSETKEHSKKAQLQTIYIRLLANTGKMDDLPILLFLIKKAVPRTVKREITSAIIKIKARIKETELVDLPGFEDRVNHVLSDYGVGNTWMDYFLDFYYWFLPAGLTITTETAKPDYEEHHINEILNSYVIKNNRKAWVLVYLAFYNPEALANIAYTDEYNDARISAVNWFNERERTRIDHLHLKIPEQYLAQILSHPEKWEKLSGYIQASKGEKLSVDEILVGLGQEDDLSQRKAATAIFNLDGEEVCDLIEKSAALIKDFNSLPQIEKDKRERRLSIIARMISGLLSRDKKSTETIVAKLRELIAAEKPEVKKIAMYFLVALGKDVVQVLMEELRDKVEDLRVAIVNFKEMASNKLGSELPLTAHRKFGIDQIPIFEGETKPEEDIIGDEEPDFGFSPEEQRVYDQLNQVTDETGSLVIILASLGSEGIGKIIENLNQDEYDRDLNFLVTKIIGHSKSAIKLKVLKDLYFREDLKDIVKQVIIESFSFEKPTQGNINFLTLLILFEQNRALQDSILEVLGKWGQEELVTLLKSFKKLSKDNKHEINEETKERNRGLKVGKYERGNRGFEAVKRLKELFGEQLNLTKEQERKIADTIHSANQREIDFGKGQLSKIGWTLKKLIDVGVKFHMIKLLFDEGYINIPNFPGSGG